MVMDKKVKTVAIIQARMASTRLPGKNMMDLCGKSVLTRVIERTKYAVEIDEICVATTTDHRDDIIEVEAVKNGVFVFRGPEDDVLDRFLKAADHMQADYIVRITADNPLTSPEYINKCSLIVREKAVDFAAMVNVPYGSNAEAVRTDVLRSIYERSDPGDKEHVTSYFYKNEDKYNISKLEPDDKEMRPDIRITLDTKEDYDLLQDVFEHFRDIETPLIRLTDVIDYLDSKKDEHEKRA
jgi:spore coat polysaccharide biosynthesis protein SpsF